MDAVGTPQVLVIAHRGDPHGQIENTVPALVSAVQLGADAVEIDVRCTSDGMPVLLHDPTLERLHGHPGRLRNMTSSSLRARAPHVPTLSEALDAIRPYTVPLVLDVRSLHAARAAHRAVRGWDEHRIWFCGNPLALAWLRRRDPDATLMLTWASPTPPADWLVRLVRPTYFNPWHRWVDERLVDSWHTRRTPVCTWTVDDPDRRRQLLAWGVDALITNDIKGARAQCAIAAV